MKNNDEEKRFHVVLVPNRYLKITRRFPKKMISKSKTKIGKIIFSTNTLEEIKDLYPIVSKHSIWEKTVFVVKKYKNKINVEEQEVFFF